jgi:hypothetical protein
MFIVILLIALLFGSSAQAQSITSRTDSLGYTHYDGKNVTGLSKTDSLGYKHSDWNINNKRITCLEKTDSTGFRRMTCH